MARLLYDWDEAMDFLSRRDKKLSKVIEAVGDNRLVRHNFGSPYQALFRSIIYQQLSGAAALTIFNRVVEHFPERHPKPEDVIAIDREVLRNAGMSYAKIDAVKDLSERALAGQIPNLRSLSRKSDDEIIRLLTQVRGIGVWTVQMLLIAYMGRPDVMAASDLGVRKGVMKVYNRRHLPDEKNLLRYSRRWIPYRSPVCWLMWRSLEQ